jgi:hypothetical protein
MTGDDHVRICEGPGGEILRATRLSSPPVYFILSENDVYDFMAQNFVHDVMAFIS